MEKYNAIDKFYKLQYTEEGLADLDERHRLLINILEKFIGKEILEIGCGNGVFAKKILSRFHLGRIYGIDISSDAINSACNYGIIGKCVNVDAQDLPFEDNYFNTVICGDLIEHLISPDHLLEEAYRILKAGGYILITTPNLASWYNRLLLLFGQQPYFTDISTRYPVNGPFISILPGNHLRLYTLPSLKFLLQKYNFRIAKSVGIGINTKIGYGKKYRWLVKMLNLIFKFPSINSGICIVAQKL